MNGKNITQCTKSRCDCLGRSDCCYECEYGTLRLNM